MTCIFCTKFHLIAKRTIVNLTYVVTKNNLRGIHSLTFDPLMMYYYMQSRNENEVAHQQSLTKQAKQQQQ